MRFMMMIKGDAAYEAGAQPDPRLMARIGRLTAEMMQAGVVLSTEGLAPTSKGARVKASAGKLTVLDGPFTETKELIGGFAILRAASKQEAIDMGARFIALHQEVLGPNWEGECEIRQLHDFA